MAQWLMNVPSERLLTPYEEDGWSLRVCIELRTVKRCTFNRRAMTLTGIFLAR